MTDMKIPRAQQRILDRERRAADLAAGRTPAPSAEALQKKAMRAAAKGNRLNLDNMAAVRDRQIAIVEMMPGRELVREWVESKSHPKYEGDPDVFALGGLRNSWIAARLESLGFPNGVKAPNEALKTVVEEVRAFRIAKLKRDPAVLNLKTPPWPKAPEAAQRKTKVVAPRGVKLDQARTTTRKRKKDDKPVGTPKAARGAIVTWLRGLKKGEVAVAPIEFDTLALRVAATRMKDSTEDLRWFSTVKLEDGSIQVTRRRKAVTP